MKPLTPGPLAAALLLLLMPALAPAAPGHGPLPPETLQAFRAVREDPPPPRIVRGIHYVISNEGRHYLYREAIQGSGGVYVGVGTDQNYLIAGWSRPEVLVLMDFDQVIVDLHRVYRLAFLKAETPDEFIALWRHKNAPAMCALIDEGIEDPAVRAAARRAFHMARSAVHRRLLRVKERYQQLRVPTFLDDQEQYAYLADLFRHDRVFMVRGDLTADRTVADIGAAARAARLPVRTLYLSNAERYFAYNANFKQSMLSLPLDAQSVVLRTSHFSRGRYEYTAQAGANFQLWLQSPKATSAKAMLAWREYKDGRGGLARMLRTPDQPPPPVIRTRPGDRLCCMEARRRPDPRSDALTRAAQQALGLGAGPVVAF